MKNFTVLLVFFSSLISQLLYSQDDISDRLIEKQHAEKVLLDMQTNVLFCGDFENEYNNDLWLVNWGIPWTARVDENELVENEEYGGKALRVAYPRGGVGPKETGSQFPIVFRNIPNIKNGLLQELYLRYYVKFEEGFDFRLGGKLPGLMGGSDSWTRSGGNQPDGSNGWTMRMMWRKDGRIVVYAYVPPSENKKYGSETWGQDLDCKFKAQPGQWHCIEQFVNVGTAGVDNGIVKVWIDGKLLLNINDIRFRDIDNSAGYIGGVYFSTFHGGNTAEWGPKNDSYAQFDEFVVAEKRVGCSN